MNVSKSVLMNGILAFYIAITFLSERTILGQFAMVLFLGCIILFYIENVRIRFSLYLTFGLAFICFNIIQQICNIPLYPLIAKEHLTTILICYAFEVIVYQYFISSKNLEKIGNIIVLSLAVAILLTTIINYNHLLSGVRTAEGAGISIGEISIGAINSVSYGWAASIGLVLSVTVARNQKKSTAYFSRFVFVLSIFISGTRKTLFIVLAAYIIDQLIKSKDKSQFIKCLKMLFAIVIIACIAFWLVMNVGFLYNLIGNRVENVLVYYSTGDMIGSDTSFSTRMILVQKAVDAIKQRPLFGWGLANFAPAFNGGGYYSHNNYLEIAVSCGIIGATLYFMKYICVLGVILKNIRHIDGYQQRVSLGLLVGFMSFAILEYWQITYYNRLTLMLYLFIFTYAKKCFEERKNNNVNK